MFGWGKDKKQKGGANEEAPVDGCRVINTHRKLFDFSEFRRRSDAEYAQALHEIRTGEKTSHWIWYIFPQLALHGHSEQAIFFGLRSFPEALKYLEDPVLGSRLVEISTAALEQLRPGNKRLKHLMGSSIDASKLMSCCTLFYYASKGMESNALFEELMLKCKEEINADSETEYFCKQAIEALASAAVGADAP